MTENRSVCSVGTFSKLSFNDFPCNFKDAPYKIYHLVVTLSSVMID